MRQLHKAERRPAERSAKDRLTDRNFEDLFRSVAEGAAERDARPRFPAEAFRELSAAGVTRMPVPDEGGKRASFEEEWAALRVVSKADGSVGRILDGHLNGVERVALLAPEPLRSEELSSVAAGDLLLGVWGADPIPGEGEPARLVRSGGELRLEGVKTFCSGAGGLHRALANVRDEGGKSGPPLLAYVDLTEGVEVDGSWYRSSGMRSSESHRVVFRGAKVLAVLGEPGELAREPYFSRDAIRTAVIWAGISDLALESALDVLSAKSGPGGPDDLSSLAAGRMLAFSGTAGRWIESAAGLADTDPEGLAGSYAVSLRESVAAACRDLLDEAARACGSHPFATGGPLDRARRDLEVMLLQHRLEPALARSGRSAVLDRRGGEG